MTREKELAKNTIILTVGKICTQFVSFMLLPLYTALLVPEEFGIVDLFSTYVALLVPIFNWQFENGLFRFMIDFRNEHEKQRELFSTVFIVNIFQSIIYILLFLIFQGLIHSEYKIFLAIDVVANIFLNTLLQFPRGLGKNLNYSIASFLSASVTVLFNVVLIAGIHMGAYGMFIAGLIAKAVTIFYLCISLKIWKYFSFKLYNKNIFNNVRKYSLPLIPNQLSWWFIGASDRTLVSMFISITANGVYSIANKFSSLFITFYNIFHLSWSESVSLHIEDEDKETFLTETINTMFNLFAAVCIGIISCMPLVFPFIIDEKYNDAYQQIPILMLSVLFQVVVGLYSVIYVGLKKTGEIAKTSLYAAIINIVVDLGLIHWLGLYAASISTLVAYAAMAVYRYFHVKKYINIPLQKRSIVFFCLITILSLVSYYYNHLYLNIITLIVVIVYAYLINKSFIHATFAVIAAKAKKISRNKK